MRRGYTRALLLHKADPCASFPETRPKTDRRCAFTSEKQGKPARDSLKISEKWDYSCAFTLKTCDNSALLSLPPENGENAFEISENREYPCASFLEVRPQTAAKREINCSACLDQELVQDFSENGKYLCAFSPKKSEDTTSNSERSE